MHTRVRAYISDTRTHTRHTPPYTQHGIHTHMHAEQKWRSEGADIFDMNLLEDNLGIDYQDARQRLEQLLRNPDL